MTNGKRYPASWYVIRNVIGAVVMVTSFMIFSWVLSAMMGYNKSFTD